MRTPFLLAPAGLLLLTGCLASKGDIRLLQDDLTSMRAQQAEQTRQLEQSRTRNDSVTQVRLDSAIGALAVLHDSIRVLSQRFSSYQANASQTLYEMGQQLITLQNRAGLSERQIQDFLAQLETQHERLSGDTTAGADTGAAAGPGPAQLFTLGLKQFNNGAYDTARSAFVQLLTRYPDYLGASTVSNYIAETYESQGKGVEADSAYQSVFQKYPQSPEAATALYKHALWLLKNGKTADARSALERVVRDYPNSDAAGLAADRLSKMPTP